MNKNNPICKSKLLGQSLFILLLFFTLPGLGQTTYIKKYKPISDSLGEVYGIPSCIILGIAIVESGSCTSINCKQLNNHFGIVGRNTLKHRKKRKSRYKEYPNGKASYVDFCHLMTRKKFYKHLKGNPDYSLWIDAISKSGYSEAPAEWKRRVSSTIKKYKL